MSWGIVLTPRIDGGRLLIVYWGNSIRWTWCLPRWLCLPG